MSHTLESLIIGNMTLDQVTRGLHNGTVPDSVYDRFWFLWCWSAARNHGPAGVRHDRAYAALGRDLYWKRIERVKGWCERIKARASSWGGDPKRGAALGRADTLAPRETHSGRKWSLKRVRLDRGGYDASGAYWGGGAPLWHATTDDAGAMLSTYFRASDRAEARYIIARDYPAARFYR